MGPAPLPLATPHVGPFACFLGYRNIEPCLKLLVFGKSVIHSGNLLKGKPCLVPGSLEQQCGSKKERPFSVVASASASATFPASCQLFQYLKELGGEKGRGVFSSSLALVAPAGPAKGDDTSWQQVASSFPSVTCLPGLCSESGRLDPLLGRCHAPFQAPAGTALPRLGWAELG